MLYEKGSPNKVSLDKYCLKVANSIINVSVNIKLQTELEEMETNSDNAATIGLILVELITNAMKYAFTDRKEGIIRFTLKKSDKSIVLTIADDGIGFPKDFAPNQSNGMGLVLVEMMVKQLDGEIEFKYDKGTTIRLTIPKS